MNKNALLCLVLLCICAGHLVYGGKSKIRIASLPPQTQDSTHHHHPKDKDHPHLGGSGWTLAVIVGDLKGTPISGALVSAPCTGWPAKTTDITGKAQFSGTGTCPCSVSPASVTTNKGCDVKLNVSCDSTYTVSCSQ